MKRHARRYALCACLLVLSACGGLRSPHPVDVGPPTDVAGLLRYAEYLRTLDTDTQQREYAAARTRYRREPTAEHNLQLALLLSLPAASFRSDVRAIELLNTYRNQPVADERYRDLAGFLLLTLDERHSIEQQLDTERRQHRLLQTQVDKLKAIEQRIHQRDHSKEQEWKP